MGLQSPRDHYATQQRLAALAVTAARRTWGRVDFNNIDRTWLPGIAQTLLLLTASQRTATTDAVSYVDRVVAEQGLTAPPVAQVNTAPLIAVASDGRELRTLLDAPAVAAKRATAAGAAQPEAMRSGLLTLERIVATQVQDAARAAVSVAMTARPALTGYTRMLNPPSCSRCAVLAGAFYRWNQGFLRHPLCDCRHIPTTENAADLRTSPRGYFDSLEQAEQDRIFTRSGAQAIRDGADLGQVVNARRGMTAAGTTEGIRQRRGGVRLMPEQIYQEAGDDRDEALRLLGRFGYL